MKSRKSLEYIYDVIEELGSFKYTNENRTFSYTSRSCLSKAGNPFSSHSSSTFLGLTGALTGRRDQEGVIAFKGGETLVQARLKTLKTSKEIQRYENISGSSSSSLPSPSSCISDSATSSSCGGANSLAWSETYVQSEDDLSPGVQEGTRESACSRSQCTDIPSRINKRHEDVNQIRFDQEITSFIN